MSGERPGTALPVRGGAAGGSETAEAGFDFSSFWRSSSGSARSEERVAAAHSAAAIVTLLVLAGVSVVIYRRVANTPSTQLNLQNMKMTRLTDNGKVGARSNFARRSVRGVFLAIPRSQPVGAASRSGKQGTSRSFFGGGDYGISPSHRMVTICISFADIRVTWFRPWVEHPS